MRKNWKLLMLGVITLLLQSCVTVRKARHSHHHHRHCIVINPQITDMTGLNISSVYMVSESPTAYEHRG